MNLNSDVVLQTELKIGMKFLKNTNEQIIGFTDESESNIKIYTNNVRAISPAIFFMHVFNFGIKTSFDIILFNL